MPLYDYECKNGHSFEDFSSIEKRKKKKCPTCKSTAKLVIGLPRIDYYNMGTDPYGCPTAAAKWAKMHEQMARRKSE